jgi:hypothetical protein
MGRILDERHAGRVAQRLQFVHAGGDEAADVDDDDRGRLRAEQAGDRGRVEGQRRRVAIGEAGGGAGGDDRGGRGVEGVGRDDDLAAGDTDRPQHDLEGARAGRHRDGVLHLVARRELSFEVCPDRTEGKATTLERLVDHPQDLGPVVIREPDRRGWYVLRRQGGLH